MAKALIVGAGSGLSASLARKLAARGHKVVLAARNTAKLTELAAETGAATLACDTARRDQVDTLFGKLDAIPGELDIAIYNPSARIRGPITEVDPDEVRHALDVTAFGAFLVAQQAARRMLARQVDGPRGTILFTGASAGVKGFPQSASFAMGKFALRGLAQSMARELHPQGIHVGHVVIDGGIASASRSPSPDHPDSMLSPDAIADSYLHLIDQHRSAWSWEIEVRPWVEKF